LFQLASRLRPTNLKLQLGLAAIVVIAFATATFIFSSRADAVNLHRANPVFSPDRTKVAYHVGGKLFVGNIADHREPGNKGDRDTLLATDFVDGLDWSPDGSRLLYFAKAMEAEGDDPDVHRIDVDIAVVAADGKSRPTKLVENAADLLHLQAEWSPDGQKIAFETHDNHSGAHLSVIASDGQSPAVRLASYAGYKTSKGTTKVKKALATPNAFRPSWSPDSTRLAYMIPNSGLYVTEVSGENIPTRIERIPLDQEGDIEEPTWSPDSTRIAYLVTLPWKSDLFVVNVDGSNRMNLTNHEPPFGVDQFQHMLGIPPFTWSPNGKLIAFRALTGNAEEFWPAQWPTSNLSVVPADGRSLPVNVSKNDRTGTAISPPAWSPDSKSLAYGRTKEPKQPLDTTKVAVDLFRVAASGESAPRQLAYKSNAYSEDVVWSRDGQSVLAATWESDAEQGKSVLTEVLTAGD
jgi:Tol biopolymer transport system component